MSLTPHRLLEILVRLPRVPMGYIALSGGLDSSVLLHLLSELGGQLPWTLQALHVHHGLQPDADAWQRRCETLCDELAIPLITRRLNLEPPPGESLEAVARDARYRVLAEEMEPGGMLLTAQHQDDQAETLLLQLMRGSGPAGLAAMAPLCPFHDGWLARPLLGFGRGTLEAYAQQAGIRWMEDPSNRDLRFDRNFIRHQVMPLLRSRWPAASMTLARSARFNGELVELARREAETDLHRVRDEAAEGLAISRLLGFDSIRLRHLLRHWIASSGAPTPNSRRLERIEREAVRGREDASPLIAWAGWAVRRYRDRLLLVRGAPGSPPPGPLEWVGRQALELPDGLGRLSLVEASDGIRADDWNSACIEVRFRSGGERCVPAGQTHHRPLKKLFQEWGVPPWERDRIPLLFLDGALAAVPGRLVAASFAASPGEPALQVLWKPDSRSF